MFRDLNLACAGYRGSYYSYVRKLRTRDRFTTPRRDKRSRKQNKTEKRQSKIKPRQNVQTRWEVWPGKKDKTFARLSRATQHLLFELVTTAIETKSVQRGFQVKENNERSFLAWFFMLGVNFLCLPQIKYWHPTSKESVTDTKRWVPN